jgi:peroxidase
MLGEEEKDDPQTWMTVRALYVISPDRKLRLSIHYPTTTGRNLEYVITTLLLSDSHYNKRNWISLPAAKFTSYLC